MKRWMLIVLPLVAISVAAWAQCHEPGSPGPKVEKEIRIQRMERGDHDCPMMAGRGHGYGMGRGQWWENPLVVKELGLSEAQSKQIDDLALKHRKAVVKLEADIKIAEMDFGNLIEDNGSETEIRKKAKELSQLREKMQELRIDHLLAMRKVLTAEQQKKLKELRMAPPKPMGHMQDK